MTELEKKVFREVFVNKPIMFHSDDCLLKIRDFFEKFGVGYLDFQTGYTHNVIMLNDNLNAYYLHRFNISDRIYNFDLLLQDYKETIRRKKMSKSIYEDAFNHLDELVDALAHTEGSFLYRHYLDNIRLKLKQAQKQEKLLKLYRTLVNEWDDLTYKEVLRIDNEIKELENEKV